MSEQPHSDADFVKRVRGVLDAEALTPAIAERLRAVRRGAVAAMSIRPVYVPKRWLPVGALAATLLAVVMLRPSIDPGATLVLDDEVQLAAAADIDLLENLEFAAWMVESDGNDEG